MSPPYLSFQTGAAKVEKFHFVGWKKETAIFANFKAKKP
jgi:hypothetical protein